MLYLKDAKVNYVGKKFKSRPPNCMYKCKVMHDTTQKYLLVVDYYTPIRRGKRLKAGWWIALRPPGHVPRIRPQLVLFIKEGFETPDLEVIEKLLTIIFLRGNHENLQLYGTRY